MDESNLAEAIQGILSDPETSNKIQELVNNLSGTQDNTPAPALPSGGQSMPDISKLLKLKGMFDTAMKEEDPKITLLSALRPYLSESRSQNLDKCMKFLRFYKIAIQLKDTEIIKELF